MVLMKMSAPHGGISVELWKRIGFPKMLYGSELWQLNRHDIVELEKVQMLRCTLFRGCYLGYLGLLLDGFWQGWVDYKIFVVRYNYSYFKNM
jgi:hypothetical protein